MSISRDCPNCQRPILEEGALCPHCGYRIGEPIAFWPRMASCGGVFAALMFAVGGFCSVVGGYGLQQPARYESLGDGLAILGGNPTVAIVTLIVYVVWVRFQWPTLSVTERFVLLISGRPMWVALCGVVSILCLTATVSAAFAFFDGLIRLDAIGLISMLEPILAAMSLVTLGLSFRGRK